jgi:hypothetical protein
MLQLNPHLPMNTPKGEGFVHFLIDYGPESDPDWTFLITATGEIWTFAHRHEPSCCEPFHHASGITRL